MSKIMSKIEWTDMTWNPVWGCKNNCEYCYARNMAKRFGKKIGWRESFYRWAWKYRIGSYYKIDREYEENRELLVNDLIDFKPTWLESNFDKKFPKKPSRIFVNSMSDIAYWKKEWMYKAKDKMKEYPQHTFQFLTKKPEVYSRFMWPENCILGVTITNQEQLKNARGYFNFISFEPLHGKIDVLDIPSVSWIIIGAETGNRKNNITPKWEWITEIMDHCKLRKIPYFLKDNINNIYEFKFHVEDWKKFQNFPHIKDKT
jgi:protein gp37